MKTVLIVSFYYPPFSGGGVNRVLRFSKALTSAGKNVIVVAPQPQQQSIVKKKNSYVQLPTLIRKLCALSSGSSSALPAKSNKLPILLWKLFKFLSIPDRQIYWLPFMIKKIYEITRNTKIDCIITTSPPVSSHICGSLLQKILKAPWLVEFRDTWVYDPLEPFLLRSKWRYRIEGFLEKRVVSKCNGIIVNSNIALEYFQQRYHRNKRNRIALIHTGYDTDDYKSTKEKRRSRKFTIVHTGSFSVSRYSIKIENLLKGLRHAIAGNKQFAQDAEVLLVGNLNNREKYLVETMSLGSLVKIIPPVEHQEAIQFQKNADLLIVLNHASSIRTADIPGKVFEYIGAGKPILAITTPGALGDIVKRANGFIVKPGDYQAIGKIFLQLFELHRNNKLNQCVSQDLRIEMTTDNNVAQLIAFMDEVHQKYHE